MNPPVRINAWMAAILVCGSASAEALDVQILSAVVRDQVIADAEVIAQKNGTASRTTRTGADGRAQLAGPDDSSVTLIVKRAGYSNLVVQCPCGGLAYALSPHMASLDALRIVLDWGSTPADLDSHLSYAGSHVSYSTKRGPGAILDVDDVNGFGPETITITQKQAGTKYVYAVHNFTDGDRRGTTAISQVSLAKVFVYIGSSLVRTFRPPPTKVGNTWIVFGIGADGEFTDVNEFADLSDRAIVKTRLQELLNNTFRSAPVTTAASIRTADQANREGEKAYHRRDHQRAVSLYLEAINGNPENGQAYSNLGLVYQKMGHRAEAIWANRKAIAVASGPTRDPVQASSFFNIGRIYEEESRWQEALDGYVAASRLRQHPSYEQGISRMRAKLRR